MEYFDVAVIGSGALGSSAAFHLAKQGRSVALIDKAEIGSQTHPAPPAIPVNCVAPTS